MKIDVTQFKVRAAGTRWCISGNGPLCFGLCFPESRCRSDCIRVEFISQSHDTSLSLIERARREDPEAWRRIVRLYGPLVLHWCRQAGLPEHDAQDVCQETFGAVARGLPSFRRNREGDTFRGWLRTITRNKLADFGRRRASVPEAVGGSAHLRRVEEWEAPRGAGQSAGQGADGPAGDEAALSFEASISRRALEFIRDEFEERSWRAFWRTAIDGQKAKDVADELEMSPAAVRKAKSRVLARLRSELEGLVDFT